MSDLCTRLGFTGNALNTCRNLEQTSLTPAGIYSLVSGILQRTPQLLTGIPETIKNSIVNVVTTTMISQQLPWFIGFVIILIVLAVTKVITPLVAILLAILMIVIVLIVFSIMVNSVKRTVDTLISDLQRRVGQNWDSNRNTVLG